MQRPVPLAISLALALGACRIERTPDEYFDHAGTIEADFVLAEGEIRDRILSFTGAVARADPATALLSLNPAEDAAVIRADGTVVTGAAQVRALVQELAAAPSLLQLRELVVETGATTLVAWFRVQVEVNRDTPQAARYRVSGTYANDAGSWRLVQAQLSGPFTIAPHSAEPAPPSRSDSGARREGVE